MPPASNILILGGGIAGIAAALALSKELSPLDPNINIRLFELRDIPSTSGGAINLTPVAQRHLAQLGILEELDKMGPDGGVDVDGIEYYSIHTGRKMGFIDFAGKKGQGYGGFKGRRVMRINLHLAMLAAAERIGNISIEFGKKVIGGMETQKSVTIHFADGSSATGDIAIGCDGVHSSTRTKIVDPERPSEYTGISFIQTTIKTDQIDSPIHFEATAMNRSRRGALLTTFCDLERTEIFTAGLVQIDSSLLSNDAWKQEGAGSYRPRWTPLKALRDDIRERFGESVIPCIREIVDKAEGWSIYPVYQLAPGGKWFTERIILLGDAAHAMPPRDESAAYALDDAILLARVLAIYYEHPLPDAFLTYDELRRKPINDAYRDSNAGWANNRDHGKWACRLEEWLTPWHLRRKKRARVGAWVFDAQSVPIPSPRVWKDEDSWS
ncbi:hypothetical protein LOZ53_005584 [Ophidiomyces ophidiicola]|nr:hypothetical protein LOZ55_006297 [Ophidiomyces ophidiicola]KAI1984125.1 hypothetical protein LOZ53_005584 [Ophidiomyces ophidiicola]KAI1984535.1 hypothetical protein LOZ51_006613 [Ophidiomyces ophidiicola]KAI1987819.1 hypothetical protein LOZ54_003414 [Ophidiomyces ophidiicola]